MAKYEPKSLPSGRNFQKQQSFLMRIVLYVLPKSLWGVLHGALQPIPVRVLREKHNGIVNRISNSQNF